MARHSLLAEWATTGMRRFRFVDSVTRQRVDLQAAEALVSPDRYRDGKRLRRSGRCYV